jgi:hypothetical protein
MSLATLADDPEATVEDDPVPDDRALLGHLLHDPILAGLHRGHPDWEGLRPDLGDADDELLLAGRDR